MKRQSIMSWMTLGALVCTYPSLAAATDLSAGQRIFKQNCGSCHGDDGKGEGWLSQYLKSPVPSLVQLKKKNKGDFPSKRIYQIIDGREEVKAHGPRIMPVWGATFDTQSSDNEPSNSKSYTEKKVRKRILAVIDYISQIQE